MNIRKSVLLLITVFSMLLCSCSPLVFVDGGCSEKENNILPTYFSYNNTSSDYPIVNFKSEEVYIDGCIYYRSNSTLLRYNTQTGRRTYVCIDPLCSHDSNICPLYGFLTCSYYNGKWYMLKSGYPDEYDYYSCYDPENGTEERFAINKTVSDGNMHIRETVFCGDYMYFYEVNYEPGKKGEEDKYSFALMKVSLSTGEVQKVMEFADDGSFSRGYDKLLFADDGKIYLCEVSKGIYYFLADGSDRYAKHFIYESDQPRFGEMLVTYQLVGNSIICSEFKITDDTESSHYYKIGLDGTYAELATIESAYDECFTDKYMYFLSRDTQRYIGEFKSEKYPQVNGPVYVDVVKICRMDYEGNIETVWGGFPDEAPYSTCDLGRLSCVWGDYLYLKYSHYGSVKKDVYVEDDHVGVLSGFVRIDMKTGEIIYVSGNDQ